MPATVVHRMTMGNRAILEVAGGNPNGVISAPKGSLAIDVDTPRLYQNTDGATAWTLAGSLSGGMVVALNEQEHATGSLTYTRASVTTIDFDRFHFNAPLVAWNQVSVPSGGGGEAAVRLYNVTDATMLAELMPITTTGIKSMAVASFPTGKKVVEFQHKRNAGGGNTEIEGGVFFTG